MFQMIISTFLLVPYLVFILAFFILSKWTKKRPKQTFGIAADLTTFALLFAVPIAIEALFEVKTMIYFFCLVIVIGVVLTIYEWKSKKEIELIPLLRKIWRLLFLLLSILYIIVFCLGLILKIIQYQF